MTTRDKVGILVLIGLFVVLCGVLAWSVRPLGPAHPVEDSYFVQQRMKILQKTQ